MAKRISPKFAKVKSSDFGVITALSCLDVKGLLRHVFKYPHI